MEMSPALPYVHTCKRIHTFASFSQVLKSRRGAILENLCGAGLTDFPVVVPVLVLNDPRCKIHQLTDQLGNNVGLFLTAANDVEWRSFLVL